MENSCLLDSFRNRSSFDPRQKPSSVRLMRDGKTYEIRANRLFEDAAMNTTLRGRDRIVIEEDRRYFTALGATGSERLIQFDKDAITALEAISMIGGLNDGRADPKGVLVRRRPNEGLLGGMLEENFITSMIKSNGDLTAFVARPIALSLAILTALVWFAPLLLRMLRKPAPAS